MAQDRPAARCEQQGVAFFSEQAQTNPDRMAGSQAPQTATQRIPPRPLDLCSA